MDEQGTEEQTSKEQAGEITETVPSSLGEGKVEVYDGGGVIVRGPGGRMLPGSRTPKPITKENSHAFLQARQDKTRRLLQREIAQQTTIKLKTSDNSPAAAVAAAGGMLWSDIVLNKDSYDRDRLEAWQAIGKQAGLLADSKQEASKQVTNVLVLDAEQARDALALLAQLQAGRHEAAAETTSE